MEVFIGFAFGMMMTSSLIQIFANKTWIYKEGFNEGYLKGKEDKK